VSELIESGHPNDMDQRMEAVRDAFSSRAAVIDSLRQPAELAQLKVVGTRLAYAILRITDDDGLWAGLREGANRTAELTEQQRTDLNPLIGMDFSLLLESLGYAGEPPARLLSCVVNEAVLDVLQAPSAVDVEPARENARRLGNALLELTGSPSEDAIAHRRMLRKGVVVAGGLALVAGLGTIGALLAPPAAAAATVVAVKTPWALTALGLFGDKLTDKLTDKLVDSAATFLQGLATKLVDHIPGLRIDPTASAALEEIDPDEVARDAFPNVQGPLGRLQADVRLQAEIDAEEVAASKLLDGQPSFPEGSGIVRAGEVRALSIRWASGLYQVWQLELGSTKDQHLLDRLARRAEQLIADLPRVALGRPPDADAFDSLDSELSQVFIDLAAFVAQGLPPHSPRRHE
jgi:hypothetical protein